MVPEDVRRRLRAELHDARQINGTAFVHVNVRTTGNRSRRHCGNRYNEILLFSYGYCVVTKLEGTAIN